MRPLVRNRRGGFTLVEVVVVVMLLGILAAIAAPRVLGAADTATDHAVRQSLCVIRDAIDRFSAAEAGKLPGSDGQEATFVTDLMPYLRGAEFPTCPIGRAKNNRVKMITGNGSLAASITSSQSTHGWAYRFDTGEFYVNCDDPTADQKTTYDQL